MITIDDARRRILSYMDAGTTESVPLDDALGRTLAESVTALDPLPPFDNSAMDGYAVRAADTADASEATPATLTAIGATIAAGAAPGGSVGSGQAARIMTGAPMPEGADAVVMVEVTETDGDAVRVKAPVAERENVRFAGEDIKVGVEAFGPGVLIRPSHIALAAALGRADLTVGTRPRVAILSTGDELVEPGKPLAPGQIRNSNAYALAAEVRAAGGTPIRMGIARDTVDDVRTKIDEALASADVVVSTGGVSVGDYDVVKDVLAQLGELVFWEVAMKPGKPLAFGVIGGKPFFGVPGNPAASVVSFEVFIRPALLKMQGRTQVLRPTVDAIADATMKKKPGRAHLVRAISTLMPDGLHVRPAGAQGSAILTTMTRADCLLVLPADATEVAAGQRVPAILLREEY